MLARWRARKPFILGIPDWDKVATAERRVIYRWFDTAAVGASFVLLVILSSALHAQQSPCVTGAPVIVTPGDHPATVLQASGASCRVHYEDAAFADGWTYIFNVRPADKDVKASATAGRGPRLGRYTIAVGTGAYDGYLVLRSASEYELFLPGGASGGRGTYAFDAAGPRLRWISGPVTDPRWDGTQRLEGDGAMLKIRIGKRAVATNTGP